jgi:2-oxoglutarate ferredoxin oxidoreductase subunit alpha
VDESARNALEQIEKRMKKMDALKKELPEPELFGAKDPELLVVGWGSTKGAVLDALKSDDLSEKKISYLHYTYVWPLKTDVFDRLQRSAKRVVLIEGNYQGQLGLLLQQQCRASFHDKILKYDGRPFFYDEVVSSLLTQWKSL